MKRKLAAMALIVLSLLAFAAPMTQAEMTEVLYLTNSQEGTTDFTKLFRVDLDSSASPPRANLTLLYDIPFKQVDALACSPDGTLIYAINKADSMIGTYNVTTDAWQSLGIQVKMGANQITHIVLAAFGPDGKLYVASDLTSNIYTVDLTTGQATDLGNPGIAVHGADLIFDALGNLYLYTNSTGTLYKITLGSPNVATQITSPTGGWFTGLAIRSNGTGNFVGSRNPAGAGQPGIIQEFDTQGIVTNYPMYFGTDPYTQYKYGDMTVGPLQICTKTIGYWKNHSWGGKIVTILGQDVNEETGKNIMTGASGKNFSMFFAQLIAAKLNFGGYNEVISAAEAYLLSQFLAGWKKAEGDAPLEAEVYFKPFPSKSVKTTASGHWEALDEFNNMYPCDEQ